MNIKILITGIPGMGKTTIGEYLAENYNFIHWDVEKEPGRSDLLTQSGDIVISWGFPVKESNIEIVKKLRDSGFDLLWFDGDREAARREFVARDSKLEIEKYNTQLLLLDKQLMNINESNVVKRLKPRIINTLDKDHEFREKKDIIEEILNF